MHRASITKDTGTLIVPNWPSRFWFTVSQDLLLTKLFIIPSNAYSLYLTNQPDFRTDDMSGVIGAICIGSSVICSVEFWTWSWILGPKVRQNCMHYRDGDDLDFALDTDGLDTLNAGVTKGAEFLTIYFTKSNWEYSSARTAPSALSSILPAVNLSTFGEQILIKRLLRWMLKYRTIFFFGGGGGVALQNLIKGVA